MTLTLGYGDSTPSSTRLYSVTSGISGVLWYTVAMGALLTMISLIVLMDYPFRGETPQAFQLIYDQLMKE